MKALKIIVITIGVLTALFIVIGFFIPSAWQITRSETMAASKGRIYEHVANLHKWPEWSPWGAEHDPSLVYTYEGPDVGVGAQQNWTSDKMGRGWLKILEADESKGITYELFIDMGNFASTIKGTMEFESDDEKTTVTWTDSGDAGNNLAKRWMTLIMKPMLGNDIEKGLKNLKALVEK